MAFEDDWDPDREEERDYFDAQQAQRHLLIVRAFDAPRYYRSENNQDGMVYPNRSRGQTFEPFPNMVVRAAVADLDVDGGKIYPEAVLFPFTITKVAKNWVGKGPQLVMWRKGAGQTDPYELRNMRNDEDAVKAGVAFLDAHPEFLTLAAPEPYEERAPSREPDRRQEPRDNGWGRQDDRPRYEDHGRNDNRGRNRSDDRGSRDWGQHDDRGGQRRPGPQDDPWARQGGDDGSFLARSADTSRGGGQPDEAPF